MNSAPHSVGPCGRPSPCNATGSATQQLEFPRILTEERTGLERCRGLSKLCGLEAHSNAGLSEINLEAGF